MKNQQRFKPYRPLIIILGGIIILYLSYILINRQLVLNSSYGVKANPLRKRLRVPIIEENMRSHDTYSKFGNRWWVADEYPDYGKISHIFKYVRVDRNSFKIREEEDAFSRRINDSVFQELILGFKFVGDTVTRENGLFVLRQNTESLNYDAKEKVLDSHAIDSIAVQWHLNSLLKGK
ncbi:MAG: hypothetical protein JO080_06050 [Mucilaginibacter sp.]|nr:hypothetical protein [Mucilaginibacter sp.]